MPASPIPPSFHATVEPGEGGAIVRFAGELDLGTVAEAEAAVARARLESPGSLRLDLSELTFVDSSGLRLIVQVDAACRREGCGFSVVPGPRAVQRVFELAGVLELLPFADPTR